MRCQNCRESMSQAEAEAVGSASCYDERYAGLCLDCFHEAWNEHEQNQTMLGPCQDEGDKSAS